MKLPWLWFLSPYQAMRRGGEVGEFWCTNRGGSLLSSMSETRAGILRIVFAAFSYILGASTQGEVFPPKNSGSTPRWFFFSCVYKAKIPDHYMCGCRDWAPLSGGGMMGAR